MANYDYKKYMRDFKNSHKSFTVNLDNERDAALIKVLQNEKNISGAIRDALYTAKYIKDNHIHI